MQRYCVIIPAYRVGSAIGPLVAAVRAYQLPVVVVDDGSPDTTAAEATWHGAVVLRHARNQGKGCALRTGFTYALEEGFEALVTMDGDGQHDPADLPALLAAADRHPDAVIVGNRMHAPQQMPWSRWQANATAATLVSSVTGQRIPDSQSGFRVIPSRLLQRLPCHARRYGLETELLLRAAEAGIAIRSVPVRCVYTGQVSHIRWWRDLPAFFAVVGRHLAGSTCGLLR